MKRFLIGLGCAMAIFSTSAVVNAATTQTPSHIQYQGKHQGKYMQLAEVNCRWVGGYWKYGYWHPAKKVCYSYKRHYKKFHHCKWIGGHWRHGHHYPAKKVCW